MRDRYVKIREEMFVEREFSFSVSLVVRFWGEGRLFFRR